MFKWKLAVFILSVVVLAMGVWTWGRSDMSSLEVVPQGPPAGQTTDPQFKSLQEEVHQIEESDKKWKWPKLEDVGIWAGIASLIVTVLIAAGGILLGHAYIANIAEKILEANNLLMTGRIQSGIAMLAIRLQWNEKKGYERNAHIDLEDLIFLRGTIALEAYYDFDRLKKGENESQSQRYRLACMNNLLLSYALADDHEKYGGKAAALLTDWEKEIPAKERRAVTYRLTEIRVQATYPEDVYDYSSRHQYREQLAKLEKDVKKLAKDKDASKVEVESLLKKLSEAALRFQGN